MNKRLSLTAQAHTMIQQYLMAGDFAIDATVGNGHDTLFLAKQVGTKGKVFGFDVQQQAIDSTLSRLEGENITETAQLFHHSHHKMKQYIPIDFHGKIKAIMFNLGYLPGSDKSIITETDSTLVALEQSIYLLDASGILTITAYPGHSGGDTETDEVKRWLDHLSSDHYNIQTIVSSDKETAPRLYVIQKTPRIQKTIPPIPTYEQIKSSEFEEKHSKTG